MKFSTRGTTKSILLKYAKGNTNNHKLEVRVSATTVRLIKKFPLFHTGGMGVIYNCAYSHRLFCRGFGYEFCCKGW